ncbi:MAG: CPBP family intramembrane glutamic endopeptidase [Bacteroidota bacterium]|nr:CPBP family intramembrane glutamic endopeptidase [Bacteroidota bacterium]
MSNHWKELRIIVLIIFSAFVLLNLAISGYYIISGGVSSSGIENLLEDRVLMLSLNSLSIMIFISPYFYVNKLSNYSIKIFPINSTPVILVLLSTFFFMILNSGVIEWNKSINFPEFMNSFETWAFNKEKELEKITIFLVSFENNWEFLFGILSIALIPGICEEYLFRGVLQKNFYLISKNIHIAVWLSAFFFSVLHLQFYGFFPRMLLGVLFGYIYYWSGSIVYPMIAHIFNNFFSLTIFYFSQKGLLNENFEVSVNSSPKIPMALIIISAVLFIGFMYLLRRYFLDNEKR